jgi:transcription elongation factor GreA
MRVPTRKSELDRKALAKDEPVYLTKEAVERMKQKVLRLKASLPKLRGELQEAQAQGDLSENAGYHTAKSALRKAMGDIERLEFTVANAVIIEGAGRDTVGIGSTVTLKGPAGETTYTIVGSIESSPGQGRISHTSPLGTALLGKRVGESALVNGNTFTILTLT